jgi:hypothetical protein
VFAVAIAGCGANGSALKTTPAGKINGHDLSITYLEHADPNKGYLAWIHKEGGAWHVDKVEPAWSTAADEPVLPGGERLYVSPSRDGAFVVSPIFTQSKMNGTPTPWGRMEVFDCGLNWPHQPGNTPCESALTKKHWSPEGLAGGQYDIDREAIETAVRQGGVHGRVTRVVDNVGILAIVPAMAAANMSVIRQEGQLSEGQPVNFGVSFGDVEGAKANGKISCSLKSKLDHYSVPFRPDITPQTLEVEAVVTRCRISDPRPATFEATDHTLTARLETFVPGGNSGINLSNDSSNFVSISAVSAYYLGEINALSNLTIELPPHASKTYYLPLWKPASIDLDESTAATKRYRFGLAVKYKTGSQGEGTLFREDDIQLR